MGRPAGSTLGADLSQNFQASRQRAEAIAGRWLGSQDQTAAPLRDRQGKLLHLVMDSYALSEPGAVSQIRALGRSEGETVCIFEQERWVAEVDFSVPGQMTLLALSEDVASRLQAQLVSLSGISFQRRQIDRLEALSQQPSPVAGMLDFKQRFFQSFPREANQKLDGMTPLEAAAAKDMRPRLLALLNELEAKESELPKAERYNFRQLREELGL